MPSSTLRGFPLLILPLSPVSPPPQPLLAAITTSLNAAYAINHRTHWTASRITSPSTLLTGYPFPTSDPQERLLFLYYKPAVLGSGEGIVVRDISSTVHEIAKPIACVIIASSPDAPNAKSKSWYVGMLGVDLEYQRRGLSSWIMRDVEEYAINRGGAEKVLVELQAVKEVGNRELYVKWGYETVWERRMEKGTYGSLKEFTLVHLEKIVKGTEGDGEKKERWVVTEKEAERLEKVAV